MSKRILFVDDEELILRSLKRLFNRSEYDCTFMSSPIEALEHLKFSLYDLVISDVRMPEMDGYEFLKSIKANYPETIRLALSGFSDSETVLKLVNENISRIYLFKPWDNNELLGVVKKVFNMKESFSSNEIVKFIGTLEELPTLPNVYYEIDRLIEKNESVQKIGAMIEQDQTLAVQILKIANTAYYGRKTSSVSDAIMYIGLNNIKNIILSTSIMSTDLESDTMSKLWEHTAFTNKLVPVLYERILNKKLPKVFSSVGLLHDIGKLVFFMYDSQKYESLNEMAKKENVYIEDLEKKVFGVTHQEIGAYLMDWWELPFSYVESAMYYRKPIGISLINKELVYIIRIANYFSLKQSFPDFNNDEIEVEILEALNTTYDELENTVNNIIAG